jgi:hypothetical protein
MTVVMLLIVRNAADINWDGTPLAFVQNAQNKTKNKAEQKTMSKNIRAVHFVWNDPSKGETMIAFSRSETKASALRRGLRIAKDEGFTTAAISYPYAKNNQYPILHENNWIGWIHLDSI